MNTRSTVNSWNVTLNLLKNLFKSNGFLKHSFFYASIELKNSNLLRSSLVSQCPKSLPANYLSISILSIPSLWDKSHGPTSFMLEKHKIINDKYYGFWKERSIANLLPFVSISGTNLMNSRDNLRYLNSIYRKPWVNYGIQLLWTKFLLTDPK